MFPLTHVLTAGILLERDHRVVLGSIFPDLGNAIGLNRDITHEMGTGFFGFCRDTYPEYLDFARAIITHGSRPRGLDYFADDSFGGKKTGYCFQRAMPLVEKVIHATGIPTEMGLWKAHNFIEMAYDLITARMFPGVTAAVAAMLADNTVINDCSGILGDYFNMDTSRIGVVISSMPKFFCLDDVTPLHLAEKYALQLKTRHDQRATDTEEMAAVIEEAGDLVAGEYTGFIDETTGLVKKMLSQFTA